MCSPDHAVLNARRAADVLAGNTPVLVHNDGGGAIPWGDPNAFDPNALRGMSAAEIEAAIPDTWERVPSARGGGMVYKGMYSA